MLHERKDLGVLARALRLVRLLDALHDERAGLGGLAHQRTQLLLRHRDRERHAEPVHEIDERAVLRVEEIPLGLREDEVVHDVEDEVVHRLRVAVQDAPAQLVDDRALLVHHVVVFERALADGEVLLLDATLRRLDGAVEPAVLHHLALLEAEALHDARDALRPEQAHELVLERDEELRAAGVALARAAAAQLAVDAPRLVPLGADHVQAADLGDAVPELDVRAAPRHVRRDRDRALLARERDDLGFARMVLRVQHLVRDARDLEHAREDFGRRDLDRAEQDRLALRVAPLDVGDDRLELLALRAVDLVVAVDAVHRTVRRDRDDVELVDVLELARLRLGRARHAGELLVEAEVVLDRDRRERLRLLLDLDALLRLDGLVQAVRPPAARQDAPRELVDDVDVVVLHDILDVALVEAVGPQELVHDVHAVGLLGERRLRVAPPLDALGVGERLVAVDRRHLRGEVGQDEHLRVLRTDLLAPLVGQRDLARALVDREVELVLQLPRALLAHLGEHLHLDVLVVLAQLRVLEHVPELLVARHRVVDLVDLLLERVDVARVDRLLRRLHEVVAHRRLHADDGRDERVELDVDVRRRDRRRAGDDERRARLVDEDRVDLVDDREVVAVLHDLARLLGHAVVAQVVEAELAVRAVRDVAGVLGAALLRVHRVLDAPDREAEVLVEVAHPRRVAQGEVVVHRHELDVLAGKRVQVERQRRHERLALARLHLGDLALVEDDAADELHVERHHVPGERVAADLLGRPGQMAAGVLHEGVRLGQDLVERLALRQAVAERLRPLREVLVRQVLPLILLLDAVDLAHDRPELLQLAIVLRSKQKLQQIHIVRIIAKLGPPRKARHTQAIGREDEGLGGGGGRRWRLKVEVESGIVNIHAPTPTSNLPYYLIQGQSTGSPI